MTVRVGGSEGDWSRLIAFSLVTNYHPRPRGRWHDWKTIMLSFASVKTSYIQTLIRFENRSQCTIICFNTEIPLVTQPYAQRCNTALSRVTWQGRYLASQPHYSELYSMLSFLHCKATTSELVPSLALSIRRVCLRQSRLVLWFTHRIIRSTCHLW